MKWYVKTETTRVEFRTYLIEAKSRRVAIQLALRDRGQVINESCSLLKIEFTGCEKVE